MCTEQFGYFPRCYSIFYLHFYTWLYGVGIRIVPSDKRNVNAANNYAAEEGTAPSREVVSPFPDPGAPCRILTGVPPREGDESRGPRGSPEPSADGGDLRPKRLTVGGA